MKLLVTGAGGFLGRFVVREAVARGHEVHALVRRPPAEPPRDHAIVHGDLCVPGSWCEAVGRADAVIHLAMGSGGFAEQFAGTVVGTENLLAAWGRSTLVLASTFSIYDYLAVRAGARLDESSPIETHPLRRDAYLQTKLVQEELARQHAQTGAAVVILRPGAIYGAGHLWNGGAAFSIGALPVCIGPRGELKLTYVENCAAAFVTAAERREAHGHTLNIVDDDLPTARQYAAALRRHGFAAPAPLPVPYAAAAAVARAADGVNRWRWGGRAKLPALVVPARLASQYKPLRYANARAKAVLGWSPRYTLDDSLARIAPSGAVS